MNSRTRRSCLPSRPGAHRPIRTAATRTITAIVIVEACMVAVTSSFAGSRRRAAACGGPQRGDCRCGPPAANVARATLYRHFPSGNDLLAAAFNTLIPPVPVPPAEGSLRDRLVPLVVAQAESIAEAPAVMTAMSWLALRRDLDGMPEPLDTPHR